MRFYQFKQGTPQWAKIKMYYDNTDSWNSSVDTINELLECDANHNIAISSDSLKMKYVPSHLKDQFNVRPRDSFYSAKKNSDINKQWKNLCKTLGLVKYSSHNLMMDLGWIFVDAGIIRMFADYYVETNENSLEKFSTENGYLEELNPTEYYRIKAEFEESVR